MQSPKFDFHYTTWKFNRQIAIYKIHSPAKPWIDPILQKSLRVVPIPMELVLHLPPH